MAILTTGRASVNTKESFSPASSFLELVEYDEKARTMEITFRTGTKIRYFQVYPATFQSFKESPTHSAFYSRLLKGSLMGAKIIDKGIGTQKSAPLKQITRSEPLDRGLREQRSRDERVRAGTVDRAFDVAA